MVGSGREWEGRRGKEWKRECKVKREKEYEGVEGSRRK